MVRVHLPWACMCVLEIKDRDAMKSVVDPGLLSVEMLKL